ncbi:hypothetical protein D3C71_2206840 [compost metagenome]
MTDDKKFLGYAPLKLRVLFWVDLRDGRANDGDGATAVFYSRLVCNGVNALRQP